MKAVLTIVILLLTATPAFANGDLELTDKTTVKVIKVEKETLIASHNGNEIRVRLLGLQCAGKATRLSTKLVKGKNVTLRSDKSFLPILMDNHNRYVAYVELENGSDLGTKLVKSGACDGGSWKTAHPKKQLYASR